MLVTCDDDNIGSIKTIEKNGGVMEDVVSGPVPRYAEAAVLDPRTSRRYMSDLTGVLRWYGRFATGWCRVGGVPFRARELLYPLRALPG